MDYPVEFVTVGTRNFLLGEQIRAIVPRSVPPKEVVITSSQSCMEIRRVAYAYWAKDMSLPSTTRAISKKQ
jgi:uncharacterized membrane protein